LIIITFSAILQSNHQKGAIMATIREKLSADLQAAQSVVDNLIAESESSISSAKIAVEAIAQKIASVPDSWLDRELEDIKAFIQSL
jgi:hypothetical protein